MVSSEHCQLMAQYNEWMNSRLYALCSGIPDAQLRADRGAFFGSIYRTLNHIACIDIIFLSRLTGDPPELPDMASDLCTDFGALRETRAALDQRLLDWTRNLAPDWLATPLTYASKVDGKTRTVPHWVLMTQMFNHQTHHRGQVTTLLTQMGHDVGNTDIPFMPRFDS